MKSRFTFLLASFLMILLGTSTSRAEVGDVLTTLDQISNSKCYTITAPRGALVLNANATGVVSLKKTNGTVDNANADTDPEAGKWAILSVDGMKYFFYNVKNKMVLNGDGSMSKNLSSALELMLATNPKGNYVFKVKDGSNTLNNNNNGGFLLDSWSTEDDGNRLTIVEAGDFDASILDNLTDITFNVVDESNNVVATEVIKRCIMGVEIPSTYAGFGGVTLTTPSAVGTAENQVVNTNFTIDENFFPFKFSNSATKNPSWYVLKVNRTPARYCKSTDNNITLSNDEPTEPTPADAFCFVGSPFGFKLYNAANPTEPYGPAATAAGAALAKTSAEEAATFMFEYSSETGFETYQLLRNVTDPVGYLNDTNLRLAYWLSTNNRHDAGSNFSFIEVEEPESIIVDGIKYLINSGEATVTYPCDAEPTADGMNTYTGDIVIPDVVEYNGWTYPVTAIGRAAFCRSTITSL
ncbi:MAG: hypothetical protein SOW56_00695, partial [Bacteroidaceae bacterium]|nr:hypothetical protein [Bacteroidaceae bacterium]